MGLLERVTERVKSRSPATTRSITTLDDYLAAVNQFTFNGFPYGGGVQQTLAGEPAEHIPTDFAAYASRIYADSGPVFALMAVRMLAFSSIRFQWQRINNGRPGPVFGTQDLSILESPWEGGTTQDLLIKMITDVDLAGNFYGVIINGEIVRLRPDWVNIILAPRVVDGAVVGYKRVGYHYKEMGLYGSQEPVIFRPSEVVHFAPYPDPLASYRGMSWLTPVIRELTNDKLMTRHQKKFFENGATPNLIISMDAAVSFEEFMKFKSVMETGHEGLESAYKTLVLGGGADATSVGLNFEQMSFTATQGRGETRLAAAAGVPVTIVGFSEGLQGSSLNAGNFAQARRRLADLTMYPLWTNACGSLQHVLRVPSGSTRLWYDDRDVPFLREDAKDAAEVFHTDASVLNALVNAGWEPDSAKAAVDSYDLTLLVHSGLVSVQLQPPGSNQISNAQSSSNGAVQP